MRTLHKNILILVFIVFFTQGCAAIGSWTDAQKACANDPACLSDAKGYAKIGEAVASGFGPVAAGGTGAGIMFIALGLLGLRKKKEETK